MKNLIDKLEERFLKATMEQIGPMDMLDPDRAKECTIIALEGIVEALENIPYLRSFEDREKLIEIRKKYQEQLKKIKE